MRLALTFDDGPSEWTAPILDLLAEHDAHATFFVCGGHVIDNPSHVETIRRTVREGHEIGSHTVNHPDLTTLTAGQAVAEVNSCAYIAAAAAGTLVPLWRAPYLRCPEGLRAEVTASAATLAEAGITWAPQRHVGCTLMPGDWDEPDAEALARKVLMSVQPNDVVLLHDGRPPNQPSHAEGGSLDTRTQTVEAVRLLLPELRSRGYDLVTASELLEQ